jgi:hypothetical protein
MRETIRGNGSQTAMVGYPASNTVAFLRLGNAAGQFATPPISAP